MLEQPTLLLAVAFVAVAFALAWAGFGLLALAQESHFEQFYASNMPLAPLKRAQVAIGIIAILFTLPLCVQAQGAGFGSLLWLLMLTLSAMVVALQLTWAPRSLGGLAWVVNGLFHRSTSARSDDDSH